MSKTVIQELRLSRLSIPFKVAFRHANADRSEGASVWVEAVSPTGATGYGESCPREYVTGESVESAERFFAEHQAALRSDIVDLASLVGWMAAHENVIDANPAAWCAMELAILDMLAKENDVTIEQYLSLPQLQGSFQYSAVLGDAEAATFGAVAQRYSAQGFTDFKVKLSGELRRDSDKMDILRGMLPAPKTVRADANNVWKSADEAIAFLRALEYGFLAVEEPVSAGSYAALSTIAEALECRIILDESFLRAVQFAFIRDDPTHWLINLRVSKMGGLLRSLEVVRGAREHGIGVIVGAQVGETSLLTRAALTVANGCRDLLVAQEGAFGTHLLERDVCDPPIMFGKGGILDVSSFPLLVGAPGFGVPISQA